MEKRSLALKNVSEALNLDSNGFRQAAFMKYLQSLQILTSYLNDLFVSQGFQEMLVKKREVKQVLCMIHECSDRVAVILDDDSKSVSTSTLGKGPGDNTAVGIGDFEDSISRFPAFVKMQNENMLLLKAYQKRLERTNDKHMRMNLKLEFERRLAENSVVAKAKYDIAVKKLQKERVQKMELALRKLFSNDKNLTEKEKEKQELYASVLNYAKTEIWPCSWKLNSTELTISEAAQRIFHKIIRCSEHPFSQWLMVVQLNLRREIDHLHKQYFEYLPLLPEQSDDDQRFSKCEEHNGDWIIKSSTMEEAVKISTTKISFLQNAVNSISSDITNVIGNALQIFYLTYKSLLPDDSEIICYNLIEKYFLESVWSNLVTLYRILNLPSESKLAEIMHVHKNSSPAIFGVSTTGSISVATYRHSITLLQSVPMHRSLVQKLKILVQVSQELCGSSNNAEQSNRKCGADELISIICHVIIRSKTSELLAECLLIEQLFDVKYILGEEGYALSSFLTALKYIEIKEFTDCYNTEDP